MNEFHGQHLPIFSDYWCATDCNRFEVPDPIVYSISSDYPTYNYGKQKTIFYARKNRDYVQLKTLFTQTDSSGQIILYAITNHYISIRNSTKKISFILPIKVNNHLYATISNKNITYHFPIEHKFNKQKSDSLIHKIATIEKAWNFKQIKIDYYFAGTNDKVATMKGLDYYWGMDQTTPSGMSFGNDRIIYCSGYGENYLHEILHLYLNPIYGKSPVNHGLIYYLGGVGLVMILIG